MNDTKLIKKNKTEKKDKDKQQQLSKLALIVKEKMELAGISNRSELCREAGIAEHLLRDLLTGTTQTMNGEALLMLMDVLNQKINDHGTYKLPYIGDINGGDTKVMFDKMLELKEHNQDKNHSVQPVLIDVPFYVKDGYVLRLVGDSMNKVMLEGDLMVVDPHQIPPQNLHGKIVIIRKKEEYTCKLFNKTLMLGEPLSTNSEHKPINMRDFDTEILGRVVHSMRPLAD